MMIGMTPRRPKRRRKKARSMGPDPNEAAYTCPTCGEQIVIPIDASAGADQNYTEDCPVCCHPNVIHLEFFGPDEPPRAWAEPE